MKERYRAKHPQRPKPTLIESLWQRFDRAPDGCWVWNGSMMNEGYGVYGKRRRGESNLAHRIMYEVMVGPIPAGMTIDHLCRNRRCVNPAHLEPVSIAENVMRGESPPARNARKEACPLGHPYNAENTYMGPTGHRQCRTCNRLRGT